MTALLPPGVVASRRLWGCGLMVRLLNVRALVPRHQGLYLRPFSRARARALPPEMVLQAALLTLPAGQLLLRRDEEGCVMLEELWTRREVCRAGVGGRLVDEALLLARETPCKRLSCRPARGDLAFQAALRARHFNRRECDEVGQIFELDLARPETARPSS